MAKAKKQAKLDASVEAPRLGALSNLFGGSPDDVAAIFANYRLESVQILPNFPQLRLAEASDVTTAACESMGRPFQGAEVTVAGVSAHTNFVDPDKRRRKRMTKRFDALIEHCHDFGTKYLITETGSLNAARAWEDYPDNHTPETLESFIRAIEPSIKLAEKSGVVVLLEAHIYHVVDSAERALKVRGELGEAVGFVMDPPNFFTRALANAPKKSLRDLFAAIGPAAPVAHGKDVRYTGSDLTTPRAGTGTLDYFEFLILLSQYQPGAPLILEQIRAEELRETVDFIDRFFE